MRTITRDSIQARALVEKAFQHEQLNVLRSGQSSAVTGSVVIVAVTAWVLAGTVPPAWLYTWTAAMAVAMLIRLSLAHILRDKPQKAVTEHSLLLLRGGVLLTAIGWGLVPVFLFPPDLPRQAFLPFIAAGICGAAVASMAIDRRAVLLVIFPVLVPLAIRLFITGGEIPLAMGLLVLVFLIFIVVTTLRSERVFRDLEWLRHLSAQQTAVLQAAQRLARLGSWSLDVTSGRLEWSDAVYEIYGRDPADGPPDINMYFRELVHPDDVAILRQTEQQARRQAGQRHQVAHRTHMPDGTLIWVHIEGVVSLGPDGNPVRVDGTVQDITDSKRAEERLRDSESRLRVAQRIARIGNFYSDLKTGKLEWSDELYRIMGYAPDELPANFENFLAFIYPEDREGVIKTISQAYAATYPHGREGRAMLPVLEFRARYRDGAILWIRSEAMAELDESGKPVLVQGTVQDVTERKKIDQMKDEFISTVSHELRTPLTSIRGALGLLANGIVQTEPEKARNLLTIAHQNAERLALLVNDILDAESIALGKMSFGLQRQPLMPLVEQALAFNQSYAAQYGVSLRITGRIQQGDVCVDIERFQQAMANLLSNAIKFSTVGKTVDVSVSADSGVFRVAVADQGPGIPADFHSRVFQRFAQADASNTRTKGGTGLGLAITREIVERMQGRIGFESEIGHGTVFWIELPRVESLPPLPTSDRHVRH